MTPKVQIFDKHCIVKNIFHRCKKSVNINDIDTKKIHMVIKVHLKLSVTKIFFISASINSVNDETVF